MKVLEESQIHLSTSYYNLENTHTQKKKKEEEKKQQTTIPPSPHIHIKSTHTYNSKLVTTT